jgi:hypothetical protein
MTIPKKPKVFIIYDKKRTSMLAEEIFDALCEAGAQPWMDIKSLELGMPWKQAIECELPKSDAAIVLLHRDFEGPGYRNDEVRQALDTMRSRPIGQGFIIPFIVEPCEIPEWCKDLHAGSPTERPSTLEELFRAIDRLCDSKLTGKSKLILAREYTSNQYSTMLYNLIASSAKEHELFISVGKGDFAEQLLLRLFDEREERGQPAPKISRVWIIRLANELADELAKQGALEPGFLNKTELHIKTIQDKLKKRKIPCEVVFSHVIPEYHGWMFDDQAFINKWARNSDGYMHVNTTLFYYNAIREPSKIKEFLSLFK